MAFGWFKKKRPDENEPLEEAQAAEDAGETSDPEEAPADTGAVARWMFKVFGGTAEGDSRDWVAIRNWAAEVAL